jgi:hypothetical protein
MSAGRSDLPRGRGLSVSLAAEFARATKLDANRATLGGLAAELFLPRDTDAA